MDILQSLPFDLQHYVIDKYVQVYERRQKIKNIMIIIKQLARLKRLAEGDMIYNPKAVFTKMATNVFELYVYQSVYQLYFCIVRHGYLPHHLLSNQYNLPDPAKKDILNLYIHCVKPDMLTRERYFNGVEYVEGEMWSLFKRDGFMQF